ncbi:hypothetical protein [Aquimarina megaterium]|uniref:hypothetical protein n=1 Tax=Aquimarina megaterium TaxID=1443666 RepID=UPI00094323F5|nr:hypothetical protein [Aquimarina megaterium]
MDVPLIHASELSLDDLEVVKDLAAQNYSLKDIAAVVNVEIRSFNLSWKNKESPIYKAYRRGRIEIEISKSEMLEQRILEGNITAIQEHNNLAHQRWFDDIKKDVFDL